MAGIGKILKSQEIVLPKGQQRGRQIVKIVQNRGRINVRWILIALQIHTIQQIPAAADKHTHHLIHGIHHFGVTLAFAVFGRINAVVKFRLHPCDIDGRIDKSLHPHHAGTLLAIPEGDRRRQIAPRGVTGNSQLFPRRTQFPRMIKGPAGGRPAVVQRLGVVGLRT